MATAEFKKYSLVPGVSLNFIFGLDEAKMGQKLVPGMTLFSDSCSAMDRTGKFDTWF